MKQELKTLTELTKESLGDNVDFLIIALDKDGQCGGVTNDKEESIAQALFALMHNGTEAGEYLYRIVRANAINIVTNLNSRFSSDLRARIMNAMSDSNEQEDN